MKKKKRKILAIADKSKRLEELNKLNVARNEWKLRAMEITISCYTILKEEYE